MRKILLYTDTPLVGGAEKHMHQLAKFLLADSYECQVVCSDFKSLDEWCLQMKEDFIPVIRMKVSSKHDPRHLFELARILKEEKPDILHLHLWNPGAARYAFGVAAQHGVKIISTEHDPFELQGIKKSLKMGALKKTAHTIAVSQNNAEQMLQWYPELKGKLSVIHNGIDLESFEKQLLHFSNQEKFWLRKELFKANSDDFVVVCIATLHPRKGLKFLLEAMQKIVKDKPQIRLALIGDGPQKKELQKLIKKLGIGNNVVLLGYQENIPKILKSCELFVLPSVKEAFGLVILEAMAAQVPVIASRVGGIPEIIEDQKSGVLVEPENSEELSQKILQLMKSEALRQKLAFLGHHRVKEFDLQKMVERTEKLYDQVLKSSS